MHCQQWRINHERIFIVRDFFYIDNEVKFIRSSTETSSKLSVSQQRENELGDNVS